MSAFRKGDRCRFIKAHHSMNRILRGRVGDEGVIREIKARADGRVDCRIEFDESDKAYGLWWISSDRLEHVQNEPSD